MGKTTLYHPVPLSVIRGAAEYCGWKFGKIVQTSCHPDEGWARYTAAVQLIPERCNKMTIAQTRADLSSCFAADIEAMWLRETKGGAWIVDLVSHVTPEPENVV